MLLNNRSALTVTASSTCADATQKLHARRDTTEMGGHEG